MDKELIDKTLIKDGNGNYQRLEPLKYFGNPGGSDVVGPGINDYGRKELPLLCEEFKKFDDGKPQFSNLPQLALLDVVKAFDYGQRKYSRHNYSLGTDWLRYYDACQRHLHAWMIGEDIDESGNSHLSHSVASLMMLMDCIKTGKGTDNRNKVYENKAE